MTIKDLRKKRGMKSNEMAALLNIKPSTYSGKEKGFRKFNMAEVAIICKFFDIAAYDVEDFAGGCSK